MSSPLLPAPDLKPSQETHQSAPRQHIVLTLHGIRTFGKWQERLEELSKDKEPGVIGKHYKYGYFSILAFLLPFARWMATLRFRSTLKKLWKDYPTARI